MFLIILRAYSLGGGAYTGIEAVSNGVQILREPKVRNAKKTMLYMARLARVHGQRHHPRVPPDRLAAAPDEGHERRPRGAGLRQRGPSAAFRAGAMLVVITLVSAGCLLFVAAQTGFLDGPRILANMATDSWAPRRFAQLSDRLVTNNGIWLMGLAAFATLIYTRGSVSALLVMYAINVFLTFSLTLLGMTRHWWLERGQAGLASQLPPAARRARPLRIDPRRDDLREVRRGRLGDGRRDGLASWRSAFVGQAALPERARAAAPARRHAPERPAAAARRSRTRPSRGTSRSRSCSSTDSPGSASTPSSPSRISSRACTRTTSSCPSA